MVNLHTQNNFRILHRDVFLKTDCVDLPNINLTLMGNLNKKICGEMHKTHS